MATRDFKRDFYERLGLPRNCTPHELRRRYRQLARLYHPDVNPDPWAQQRFLRIRDAYAVLSDERERPNYDGWLARQGLRTNRFKIATQQYPNRVEAGDEPRRLYALLDISGNPTEEETTATPPLNVILVLDRSSSMRGRRLYYVKEAAKRIIDNLAESDTFGIVTFNDRGSVVLPAGPAADRSVAHTAIESIRAEGGTEIASGLKIGLQQAVLNHGAGVLSRVILLTDGLTYGDEQQALELAAKGAGEHITLTAMGLGTDWNDNFLDALAERGNGQSQYIARPSDAVQLFQEQLQQLQRTFGQLARLDLALARGVELIRAHEVSPGLRHLPVADGSITIGAIPGQPPLRVLLELRVERRIQEENVIGEANLSARHVRTGVTHERRWLILLAAAGDEDEVESPSPEIYRAAQRVATLRVQEQTWESIDEGEHDEVAESLKMLVDRFREIGADDLAKATEAEVREFERSGALSADGRKIIKYGTRMLALPAPREAV